MRVRAGSADDFPQIQRLLASAPEASQWAPEGYELIVAEIDAATVGLLVWRYTAPDEIEILNIAVDPANRRKGIAKLLLRALPKVDTFLEVRESNAAARTLYLSAGFEEVGLRKNYYDNPVEGAIVMRLQS